MNEPIQPKPKSTLDLLKDSRDHEEGIEETRQSRSAMGTEGMNWIEKNANRICAVIYALGAVVHFLFVMMWAFTFDLSAYPIYTSISFWMFLIFVPAAIFFEVKRPLTV